MGDSVRAPRLRVLKHPGAATYASKVAIRRAIEAAQEAGIEVGGIEVSPDGRIKVLAKGPTPENAYDRWKASKARA